MVFRRDSKVDAFQRQISALRQQLGDGENQGEEPSVARQGGEDYGRQGGHPEPQSGSYGFGEFASNVAPAAEASTMISQAPDLPAIPTVDAKTTVIAHNTTWKGEISSEGTVHVHGRFEGSIRATSDVYVADEADVDATIYASNVVIAGFTKGTIRCGSRFEVLPSGRVSGDVQAPTLVVHEGAVVSGQFRMGTEEVVEAKPTPVVQRRAARGTA